MSNYDDSESREWVIENFPFKYLPDNTEEIVHRPYNDVINLQGVDEDGDTTILIEVQVREQWNDLPYKDWRSRRYKDRSWGLTVEQRK